METRKKTADGGGLARAIDYSLKRWPAILRYAASGHLPIDNNPVENAVRPIALGKKNWVFAGSERAANVRLRFKPCWQLPRPTALSHSRG